ncbi:hypothetical protein [Bradyrhizobium sp.]|uniref:hypothetical protein n=1 Tax=Bradyrhizobium sp. TaxID=376 RepID=UPI003C4CB9F5
MQVKRLEQQLHAELFHRTKATVDISEAGGRPAAPSACRSQRPLTRGGPRAALVLGPVFS